MIGQSTIIGPVDIILILLIHFTWPDRQIIFLGSQYTSEPSAVNTISVVQLCLSLNGQMRSIMIRGMVDRYERRVEVIPCQRTA